MKKSEVQTILREARSVERGETAPARVREVTLLPDGKLRRLELTIQKPIAANRPAHGKPKPKPPKSATNSTSLRMHSRNCWAYRSPP